jgi:cytochrome d ubiquinol oxidase subunit I
LLNPAMAAETIHMTLAAYLAVGFLVAGIHAIMLRREPGNSFHRKAFGIAFTVGAVAALLQPLSGHHIAKTVASTQPTKLAAMEGMYQGRTWAPLHIGGFVDSKNERVRGAIEIPGALSFLAKGDPNAFVPGLDSVPRDSWPPVPVVFLAYQTMIACGMALAGLAVLGAGLAIRRRGLPEARWFLGLVALASPLGLIAIEAGWTVTEVGRQPWVIHGVMRTSDAVTSVPGIAYSLIVYALVYLFLGVVVAGLLLMQFRASPRTAEVGLSVTDARPVPKEGA